MRTHRLLCLSMLALFTVVLGLSSAPAAPAKGPAHVYTFGGIKDRKPYGADGKFVIYTYAFNYNGTNYPNNGAIVTANITPAQMISVFAINFGTQNGQLTPGRLVRGLPNNLPPIPQPTVFPKRQPIVVNGVLVGVR